MDMPDDVEPAEASSSQALSTVCITYGSITAVLMFVYCVLKNRYKKLFNVRNSVPRLNCELAKQEFGAFGWIPGVGMKLSAVGLFIAVWLIPTYYYSPTTYEDEDGNTLPRSNFNITDTLDKMSMGHTYNNDPRCIGAIFGSYLMSLCAMYLIYHEIMWFVYKRHIYMQRMTPENYTVYFSKIPPHLRCNKALTDFFKDLFPGDVLEVNFVKSIKELDGLVAQQKSLVASVKHSKAYVEIKGEQPKHVSLHKMGTVDAVQYYTQQLEEVDQQHPRKQSGGSSPSFCNENPNHVADLRASLHKEWAEHEQRVAQGDVAALETPPSSILDAAFVSFKTLRSATTALQTLHHQTPHCVLAQEAPKPGDVYWANTGMNHWQLTVQQILAGALTGALIIFWTVPISFIATFQKIESLKKQLGPDGCELDQSCPLMVASRNFPALDELLAVIAPLALVILNSLLPVILGFFCTLEGHIGQASLQASLFSKLTLFMIIQTFFVSAIAGTLMQDLNALVADPIGQIRDILAQNLPTQAVTFMSLVFLKCSAGLMTELLRVWGALFALLHWLFAPNLTEEERQTDYMGFMPLCNPGGLWFAWYFADVVFMFVVLFVYSILSPISSVLMFAVFFLLQVVYRNQLIFVYDPSNDAGGKYWTHFVWYVVVSMLIGQVTVLAVLTLNESRLAPLMIPLIIGSVLFWRYISAQHFRVASTLPVVECHETDAAFAEEGRDYKFVRGVYKQEALQGTGEGEAAGEGEAWRLEGGAGEEGKGGAGVGLTEEGRQSEREKGETVKGGPQVELVLMDPHSSRNVGALGNGSESDLSKLEVRGEAESSEGTFANGGGTSAGAEAAPKTRGSAGSEEGCSGPLEITQRAVVLTVEEEGQSGEQSAGGSGKFHLALPPVSDLHLEGAGAGAGGGGAGSLPPAGAEVKEQGPGARERESAAERWAAEEAGAGPEETLRPLAESPDKTLLCSAGRTRLVFSDLRHTGKRPEGRVFTVELPPGEEALAACFNATQPQLLVRMQTQTQVFDLLSRTFRPAEAAEVDAVPPHAWLPPKPPTVDLMADARLDAA